MLKYNGRHYIWSSSFLNELGYLQVGFWEWVPISRHFICKDLGIHQPIYQRVLWQVKCLNQVCLKSNEHKHGQVKDFSLWTQIGHCQRNCDGGSYP